MSSKKGDGVLGVLLVEDNPGDVRLVREGLRDIKAHTALDVVMDGEDAMRFLRRQGQYAGARRPDLIVLDLNLPKKDGREVLAEIKQDEALRSIPVIVLTTSDAEDDIRKAYELNANCYLAKPMDLECFLDLIKSMADFWLTIVKLPKQGDT
jgi:CheY-like chemotaxis protein